MRVYQVASNTGSSLFSQFNWHFFWWTTFLHLYPAICIPARKACGLHMFTAHYTYTYILLYTCVYIYYIKLLLYVCIIHYIYNYIYIYIYIRLGNEDIPWILARAAMVVTPLPSAPIRWAKGWGPSDSVFSKPCWLMHASGDCDNPLVDSTLKGFPLTFMHLGMGQYL